jgi:drug/metabolite transporter (DMT)-like permease
MSHSKAVFLMILATVLWSIGGVVIRHLDSSLCFEITFWRSAFNALAIAVAVTVMRGIGFWRRLLHAPKIIWLSGVCWCIMFTAYIVAMTITTVANVLIVMALGPLITALLARYFLHYKMSLVTWASIVVAGLGIASMFLEEGNSTFTMMGSLVAFAVPFTTAVNFIILQRVGLKKEDQVKNPGKKPDLDMLQSVLIGAILSALVSLPPSLPLQASMHDIGLLSMLGVFQLALPWCLLVRLSRELSAPELSLLAQLEVVFGVTWAWLWAGENLSDNTLWGGFLVLATLTVNELARCYRTRKTNNHILVEYNELVEAKASFESTKKTLV